MRRRTERHQEASYRTILAFSSRGEGIAQSQYGLVTVLFRVLEWNNRHQGEQLWHANTTMNSNVKRCALH